MEVSKSKQQRLTTDALRQFILSIVEEALTRIYGINYSIRCLQSSLGIQHLLQEFGIHSQLCLGSSCFSIVKGSNPYSVSWGGFWDQDHHLWLLSEYFELIDFTISQLHLHPKFESAKVQSIPVLWWSPADQIPPIFRYLPNELNVQVKIQLSPGENSDLELFFKAIEDIKSRKLSQDVSHFSVANFEILDGPDKLTELYNNGNHWVRGSFIIQQNNVEFPQWIVNKERELIAASSR